jgi:ADP-ribosylglycohydrolase
MMLDLTGEGVVLDGILINPGGSYGYLLSPEEARQMVLRESDRVEIIDGAERYRGSLLGLAVGDALGTTIEFQAPGSFVPVKTITGGGPFSIKLKPGEWTDDTSMALCLAESLIKQEGFDPIDQLQRYCRWQQDGHLSSNGRCFDIGITVSDALRRYRNTNEPYCGSTDPHSAGNGSIMRLAPVPSFMHSFPMKRLSARRRVHAQHTAHRKLLMRAAISPHC